MKSSVRRLRPREVALVADILSQEHEDVEELAKTVVRELNKFRATEQLYARAVNTGHRTLLYGPYPSPADALNDDLSFGIGKGETTYQVRVVPLHGPYGAVLED